MLHFISIMVMIVMAGMWSCASLLGSGLRGYCCYVSSDHSLSCLLQTLLLVVLNFISLTINFIVTLNMMMVETTTPYTLS